MLKRKKIHPKLKSDIKYPWSKYFTIKIFDLDKYKWPTNMYIRDDKTLVKVGLKLKAIVYEHDEIIKTVFSANSSNISTWYDMKDLIATTIFDYNERYTGLAITSITVIIYTSDK